MTLVVGGLFGLGLCAYLLVVGLTQWGTAFPRIGRWLDAKLYRAFPRLGHVFIPEQAQDEEVSQND
jgi:hypothetical protein